MEQWEYLNRVFNMVGKACYPKKIKHNDILKGEIMRTKYKVVFELWVQHKGGEASTEEVLESLDLDKNLKYIEYLESEESPEIDEGDYDEGAVDEFKNKHQD